MRILIFTSTATSGYETFIRNHYEALKEAHEVRMVFLGGDAKTNEEDVLLADRSEFGSWRMLNKALFFLPYLKSGLLRKELDKLCQLFKPDILHFHFGSRAVKYFDQYLITTKKPIFITFHGIDASHFFKTSFIYRKKIKRIFSRKNIFPLFVSQALIANAKKYQISSPNAEVAYLGIDTEFFSPESPKSMRSPKIYLQIARLAEKKGQMDTLRAFSMVHEELDAMLYLVGSGPMKKKLQEEIERLNLNHAVKLLPGCDAEQVKKYMAQSDFFVHPSCTPTSGDMEGLPTVIMEAMAMGLPILSTHHSGIPELVVHGVHGYLCKEHDVEQLASNMRRIYDWGFQAENRSRVVKDFNAHRQYEKLVGRYRNALQILDQVLIDKGQ